MVPRLLISLVLLFVWVPGLKAAPAAWRVEGENGAMIVFGTMHRLPPDAVWFSEELEIELKRSRLLILEVENSQVAQDYLGYLLRQPGMATSKKPLKDQLDENDYNTFLARIAPFGYREEDVMNYRPWYAITLLGMLGGDQVGLEFDAGAEETLNARAKDFGLETRGLESPAQQALFYSELPKKIEKAWLEKILRGDDKPGERSAKLFSSWINGDLKAIKEQVLTAYREIPKIYEVFIKTRNETWAEQLSLLMEDGGQLFVAVGAAHMVGRDSVLRYLEKEGFKVTRIQ